MLSKYNKLRDFYKENREVLNKETDAIKIMNYLFDIKNHIVGLIELNKIEERKQAFLHDNEKLEGEYIVELANEYGIKINPRTKNYLLTKNVFMNTEEGCGKTKPTQKCFEIVEDIQESIRDIYSNKVKEEIEYQLRLLNDRIDIAYSEFKKYIRR